jgi:hypothetical protein
MKMTDEDKKERRRTWDRARKERMRRAAGSIPIAEHLALRAARTDALNRKAAELGLTIPQMRRRIRAGKMLHPYDEMHRGA